METKNKFLSNNSYHLLTTCYVPGIVRKVFMHCISFELGYNTTKKEAVITSISQDTEVWRSKQHVQG